MRLGLFIIAAAVTITAHTRETAMAMTKPIDSLSINCPSGAYMMWTGMVAGFYISAPMAYQRNRRLFGQCWDDYVWGKPVPSSVYEFSTLYPNFELLPVSIPEDLIFTPIEEEETPGDY